MTQQPPHTVTLTIFKDTIFGRRYLVSRDVTEVPDLNELSSLSQELSNGITVQVDFDPPYPGPPHSANLPSTPDERPRP